MVDELGTATVLHAVPAVMRQVLTLARLRRAAAPRLRALFLGGDAVPADLLDDLRAGLPGRGDLGALWPDRDGDRLHPLAAAGRRAGCVPARPPASPGRRSSSATPAASPCRWACRARSGSAAPVVARGYWRREELTAEKFVDRRNGRRFYRSGDLARRLPDGTLEFLGRLDHQVKIRGFRIELGEIEAALADQPGVREAVVLARDGDHGGERRLVAYVAGRAGGPLSRRAARRPGAAGCRPTCCRRRSSSSTRCRSTASGKIDRRALPAPEDAGSGAGRPAVPPRTPLERFLADQFRDVLGLPAGREIGVDDDFFDLGGTSISGAILIYRLQEAPGGGRPRGGDLRPSDGGVARGAPPGGAVPGSRAPGDGAFWSRSRRAHPAAGRSSASTRWAARSWPIASWRAIWAPASRFMACSPPTAARGSAGDGRALRRRHPGGPAGGALPARRLVDGGSRGLRNGPPVAERWGRR